MPAHLRLWTGPPGAGLLGQLLEALPGDLGGIWITPKPLARDQAARALAIRNPTAKQQPRVYCWADLWGEIFRRAAQAPLWLSECASRAVFREAIRQVHAQGLIRAIEAVVDSPGYRGRLSDRVRAWTTDEVSPRTRKFEAEDADPIRAAEWAVYVRYRELLTNLGAEDDAGISVWASRYLLRSERPRGKAGATTPNSWTFLEYEETAPAQRRVLEHTVRRGGPVRVALTHESDPVLEDVYLASSAARRRLLELGFEETEWSSPAGRPAGLGAVEHSLFRAAPTSAPTVSRSEGLAVLGAPRGEGAGRLVASEVRRLLGSGIPAEEILVLFRKWSDQADFVVDVMRAWGLNPAVGQPRSLQSEPAVSALRAAVRLPLEEWETDQIVRLLRNGQLRPDWPDCDRMALARAAAVIQCTSAYRGRRQLLGELDRAAAETNHPRYPAEQVVHARGVVERLFTLLGPIDQPRPWSDQVDQVRKLAATLGLGAARPQILDVLWSCLDDHALAIDRLGRGQEPLSWRDFVDELEAIVAEISVEPEACPWGSIRVTTVDDAAGATADCIILGDLEEGAFPERSAVEPFLTLRAGELPDSRCRAIYGQEMNRFLRVIGSANRRLTLVYPTTDVKGQELLRAGFLDQLLERLATTARTACHTAYTRFHPALVEPAGMVGTPGDQRVRAAALASERGDLLELGRLAQDRGQCEALDGTAAALHVLQRRLRGTPFSEFEGVLTDPAAIARVGALLGDGFCYSASQIETYVGCPFQFFSRVVLKLRPPEDREELDEGYTKRGSVIHDILEKFERMAGESGSDETDRLVQIVIDQLFRVHEGEASELELGLRTMERRQAQRTMDFYLAQRAAYAGSEAARPIPRFLEQDFGGDDSEYPKFRIGDDDRAVMFRGRIDRIDLVDTPEGRFFRVIDYKSGSVPSPGQVNKGEMIQLVLYAMAAEQLMLVKEPASPLGFGYWGLRKDGYRELVFPDWPQLKEDLVAHVLSVVDRIRQGAFPVHSRKPGCESYCDFRSICRVRQVRMAGKEREEEDVELNIQARRKSTRAVRLE